MPWTPIPITRSEVAAARRDRKEGRGSSLNASATPLAADVAVVGVGIVNRIGTGRMCGGSPV